MSERQRLFLVDGSSYIYRAFFAIRRLSTSRGFPTNAIFGFTSMLTRVISDHRPDHMVICFDTKGPTFRHELYSEYKANRPEMPETLIPQIPYIKEVVAGYRIPIFEKEGYEADDLIGTLARHFESEGIDVVIVSGDKDLLQMVSPGTTTLDTMKDRILDVDGVLDQYGVRPDQITDILALMGDASDNIPGVPGIGKKKATRLVQQFESLEKLLENLDQVGDKKAREALKDHGEQARLSKRLATIDSNVPIEWNFEDFKLSDPDSEKLREIFKELEFTKFLSDMPPSNTLPTEGYKTVLAEEELTRIKEEILRAGKFAIDLETTSKNPMQAEIVGISLSYAPHEAFYIPVEHKYVGVPKQIPREIVLNELRPLLEDENIQKIGQNIKYEWVILKRYGIEIRGVGADTMIASYLLNPSKHSHRLEEIAREYLDHEMITYKDVVGTGKKEVLFDKVMVDKASLYSCEDADVTLLLADILLPKLEAEGFSELYMDLEIPLIRVLAKMEMEGVKVDQGILNEMSVDYATQLDALMEKIYEEAGERFNINSPQQLSHILFEKWKLPVLKKTKTGYSTGVDVLQELAKGHPLPAHILEYRSLSKLKSTYIDALPKLIHPDTGRVHTSFNQTVTATGRLSSSDPNLQNIPIRGPEGKRIREAFVAEKGHLILSADYSQIELRILAHTSGDRVLTDAFRIEEDIHSRTASEILGISPNDVTPEMRRQAKVINFGIIYGMSAFGLARELGIENRLAQAYIDGYFQKYRGVKAYIDGVLEEARKKGYVTTLKNRRRYLPEIKSKDNTARRFAERTAINTPIQGTAADLIKIAMIQISERIERQAMSSRMIIQVHDELVFEVPELELDRLRQIVIEEMEGVAQLAVPLKIDIQHGVNWAEAH
jgi:DNA polymerase-1